MRNKSIGSLILFLGIVFLAHFPASAASGGPDGYGYSYIDSNETGGPAVAFDNIASTGTFLDLDKDQISEEIPLGFVFTYYGTQYNSIYISTTGVLTFNRSTFWAGAASDPLPTAGGHGGNLIAGLWDNLLTPNHTCGVKNLHYISKGTYPARKFIVQWTDVKYFYTDIYNTFQIVLNENGDIQYNYYNVTVRNGSTYVGIENSSGQIGLGYAPFNTPGTYKNLSVLYTTSNIVQPTTGSLSVSILPVGAVSAGAKWSVDDSDWQDSGFTLTGLSAGAHTVQFKALSGWVTPSAKSVTVVAGETTSASGTYSVTPTEGTAALRVYLEPEEAVTAGAQWRVDSGDWQESGATVTGLAYGSHAVEFKAVSGWSAPASFTQTLSSSPFNLPIIKHMTYSVGQSQLYFPYVLSGNSWETELGLINKSSETSVTPVLKGYAADGSLVQSVSMAMAPGQRRQLTVGSTFTAPGSIAYAVLEDTGDVIVGYEKLSVDDAFRAAIPATTVHSGSVLYVPHIASDDYWATGIGLVNTTAAAKSLTIHFQDGSTASIDLPANGQRFFTIRDLFGGLAQPDIHSAYIENASGIVGLELFSGTSGEELDGVLLDSALSETLYFPHSVNDSYWWTGFVAYNPLDTAAELTIEPYDASGNPLTRSTRQVVAKGEFVTTTGDLPAGTAWFKVSAADPICGFELFGNQDGSQVAGYNVVGLQARSGIFAKLDAQGWTGIALVNTETAAATVTLSARSDQGAVVATKQLTVGAHAKLLGLPADLFGGSLAGATYVTFSADRDMVGFQLNGSADNALLDALPVLQ
jgi:hypothetical protein